MKTIFYISIILSLYSCERTRSNESETVMTALDNQDITNKNGKEIKSPNFAKSKSDKYYLEALRKYLETSVANDNGVTAHINENGDLTTEDIDGNFLSVYGLRAAEIYTGNVNGKSKPRAIVVIANVGGGGGGNIELEENYLVGDNGDVTSIDTKLVNAPKNKYGYTIYITGIEDGYILVSLTFRDKNDGFYAQGKVETYRCTLVDNQLKIKY